MYADQKPYGLRKTDRGTWVVFDRDYRPLFAVSVRETAPALRGEGTTIEPERVWLYNDKSTPNLRKNRAAYKARLALLEKLERLPL